MGRAGVRSVLTNPWNQQARAGASSRRPMMRKRPGTSRHQPNFIPTRP
jgi:hypothetical protein